MGERLTLGLIQEVTIVGDTAKSLFARVDTGATRSSIASSLVEELKLGPVIREKIVKSAAGVTKRPIIKVRVKINDLELDSEFTVADRSHMTYKVLLGQNILKEGKFLIDPLKVVGE